MRRRYGQIGSGRRARESKVERERRVGAELNVEARIDRVGRDAVVVELVGEARTEHERDQHECGHRLEETRPPPSSHGLFLCLCVCLNFGLFFFLLFLLLLFYRIIYFFNYCFFLLLLLFDVVVMR